MAEPPSPPQPSSSTPPQGSPMPEETPEVGKQAEPSKETGPNQPAYLSKTNEPGKQNESGPVIDLEKSPSPKQPVAPGIEATPKQTVESITDTSSTTGKQTGKTPRRPSTNSGKGVEGKFKTKRKIKRKTKTAKERRRKSKVKADQVSPEDYPLLTMQILPEPNSQSSTSSSSSPSGADGPTPLKGGDIMVKISLAELNELRIYAVKGKRMMMGRKRRNNGKGRKRGKRRSLKKKRYTDKNSPKKEVTNDEPPPVQTTILSTRPKSVEIGPPPPDVEIAPTMSLLPSTTDSPPGSSTALPSYESSPGLPSLQTNGPLEVQPSVAPGDQTNAMAISAEVIPAPGSPSADTTAAQNSHQAAPSGSASAVAAPSGPPPSTSTGSLSTPPGSESQSPPSSNP